MLKKKIIVGSICVTMGVYLLNAYINYTEVKRVDLAINIGSDFVGIYRGRSLDLKYPMDSKVKDSIIAYENGLLATKDAEFNISSYIGVEEIPKDVGDDWLEDADYSDNENVEESTEVDESDQTIEEGIVVEGEGVTEEQSITVEEGVTEEQLNTVEEGVTEEQLNTVDTKGVEETKGVYKKGTDYYIKVSDIEFDDKGLSEIIVDGKSVLVSVDDMPMTYGRIVKDSGYIYRLSDYDVINKLTKSKVKLYYKSNSGKILVIEVLVNKGVEGFTIVDGGIK